MTQDFQGFEDYLNIFRRRRVLIVAMVMLILFPAMIVAFMWPPTYRSTATILIVEQEVPADFVRSTITSYADQQIERIKAQVMTRSRLMPIIEEHDLYKDLRVRNTSAAALKQFIDDINVQVLSSEVVNKRTGQQTQATIAFTLSYDGVSPGMTQKIANELITLFLTENLKNREEQVQETTAFLRQETEKFTSVLSQLGEKIANFKSQAKGALPELFQMNMQLLSQTDRELSEKKHQIQEQEARIIYLQGEITQRQNAKATSTSTVIGAGFVTMGEQLKALRRQYASLASHLSKEHPDIMKLQGEIEALEREVDRPVGKDELSENLRKEQLTLASLLERYGEDHPDVVRVQATIALLEEQLSDPDLPASGLASEAPYDPISAGLQAQLASAKTALTHLYQSQGKLEQQIREYAARVERTTVLEPDYQALLRERENATQKFNEFRARLSEAEVAEGMELNRKGERFALVDPPSFPEVPVKPNRPAILMIGLLLALAGGVGSGALAESLDGSIHTIDQLRVVSKMAPLCAIPFLLTLDQERAKVRKRNFIGIGAMVFLGVSLALVHVFWLPLDVIWYAALRRVSTG